MLDEGNEGNWPEGDVVGDIKREASIGSGGDVFRETEGNMGVMGEDGFVSEPKAMSARLDNALILFWGTLSCIVFTESPLRDKCDKLFTECVDIPGFVSPSSFRL